MYICTPQKRFRGLRPRHLFCGFLCSGYKYISRTKVPTTYICVLLTCRESPSTLSGKRKFEQSRRPPFPPRILAKFMKWW